MQARVYIVDDDADVREGLTVLFQSVGHAVSAFAGAEEFLAAYDPATPACLVLDLRMPGSSGLELQETLAARGYRLPVIFLTGHGNVSAAVKALKHGAVDFFQKPVVDEQALLDRVSDAIRRDREAMERSAERSSLGRRIASLTPREREVMERVCAGQANKVIAIDLGISERTVELHRSRMLRKLGVRTVAELVRLHESARN